MERDLHPNLKKWLAEVEAKLIEAAKWPAPATGVDGMACVKQVTSSDGGGVTIMIVSGGEEEIRAWMEKALERNGGTEITSRQESPHSIQ